jgi:hypothetical protein
MTMLAPIIRSSARVAWSYLNGRERNTGHNGAVSTLEGFDTLLEVVKVSFGMFSQSLCGELPGKGVSGYANLLTVDSQPRCRVRAQTRRCPAADRCMICRCVHR